MEKNQITNACKIIKSKNQCIFFKNEEMYLSEMFFSLFNSK